jgi:acyl-CoA reductase-like NAD-dependent aldehyde dehydrogenase
VYTEEADVLRRVNDSEFGLCSSIWTADEDRGERFARGIEAGATFINSHGLFSIDPHAPFGGVKQSGLGRELARAGLEAYCEGHVISRRHL